MYSLETNNSNKNNLAKETFYGYIETTRDSLLVFEACKRGIIPRITRRLQDKERRFIRSGSIFCFDEHESGIKRWTDGLVWSPSRILGNFLIYRELDDKKRARSSSTDFGMMHGGATNIDGNDNMIVRGRISSLGGGSKTRRQREKSVVGSVKSSYKFKRNGLIKKSMSLIVDGVQQHIISYYSKEDVLSSRLKTPSSIVELSSLEVSPSLHLRQNYRIPFLMEETASDDGFMEDYQRQNNDRKRYPDFFIEPLQYEINSSSPSSFTSSNSNSSNGSNNNDHLLATLNSQFFPTHHKDHTSQITEQDQQQQEAIVTHLLKNSFISMENKTKDQRTTNIIYSNDNKSTEKRFGNTNKNNVITKSFGNFNNIKRDVPAFISSSYHSGISMNSPSATAATTAYSHLITIGGYYPSTYYDHYRQEQNPHQHLFSSTSLHAINHAAKPNRTEVATNSFMFDMNMLLGTGWSEFELQM